MQELLGDRVGKDIRLVSISLQPEHDTPEVMAAYAKTHGVGPGWLFLTGQKDDIELLRHRLGFWDIDPVVDADPEQHLGTVRIANEPMHRWAMSPSLLNPPALVRAVHRVIPRIHLRPDHGAAGRGPGKTPASLSGRAGVWCSRMLDAFSVPSQRAAGKQGSPCWR